jgi:exodeoxyribonuclease VIII
MREEVHLMIDIETLGVQDDCVILSIGAACNPNMSGLGLRFEVNIDKDDSIANGFKAEQATLDWWNKQSDASKEATLNSDEGMDVVSALGCLYYYIKDIKSYHTNIKLWAKGNFDFRILEYHYKTLGLNCPWTFRELYDYRTVANLFPDIPFIAPATAHIAIEDAKAQLKHLMTILEHIDEYR